MRLNVSLIEGRTFITVRNMSNHPFQVGVEKKYMFRQKKNKKKGSPGHGRFMRTLITNYYYLVTNYYQYVLFNFPVHFIMRTAIWLRFEASLWNHSEVFFSIRALKVFPTPYLAYVFPDHMSLKITILYVLDPCTSIRFCILALKTIISLPIYSLNSYKRSCNFAKSSIISWIHANFLWFLHYL